MDTSESYLEEYGATALVGELIVEFSATGLLPHQLLMAAVPWKQIYTTNYDDVIEKSYKNRKYSIDSITPDMPTSAVQQGQPVCIHLNGSVIGLNSAKLPSQIRLTDSSYLTSALSESDWAIRLRQDIDAAQAIFYVGYSTYDLDIARLLFPKASLRDKSFFVVGVSPGSVLKRRIEKFGTDTGLTANDFFTELSKDEYATARALAVPEKCIRTYQPAPTQLSFSDGDLFDLFMVGRLAESLVFESMTGKIQYVVHRKSIDRVLNLIEAKSSAIVVHSSLGNGKTVFLEMVKVSAAVAGFVVIELLRQQNSLLEELEFALRRPGKLLIIVDNYGDWQEALRFISSHHGNQLSVLLAARTGTNDVLASRTQAQLGLGDLQEISLDKLHENDLLHVSQIMDAYGLWGDKASWNVQKKIHHLTNHCGREWHAILINLFKSPQIKDRLDRLIEGVRGETAYSSILIAILVLAIVDHPATTDILTDLCGEKTLTVGFRQNVVVRELIDFDRDEVRLKSAVTGAFILKRVVDPELVLNSLIDITSSADQAAAVSREYLVILNSLVRFGNAQNFFPDEVRNDFVIRYYEATKQLRNCKRQPLFWLQYAIACLFAHDFDRAGTYFASAYSFAKQSNFRTFQIDNHYARYLLQRSIHDGVPSLAMEAFRSAQKLIFEQMRHERLHYPYRTALLIGDWYNEFGDQISSDELAEVRRAAHFIAARIAELPEANQQHRDVAECYKQMRIIIDAA